MQPSLDVTPIASAPLRDLDPRWKLAAAVLVGAGIVCLQALPAAGLSLLLTLLLLPLNRVSWRWFAIRLGGVALFLLLFLVLLPLTLPGVVNTSPPGRLPHFSGLMSPLVFIHL